MPEAEVFAAYKKEKKLGLEWVKCKQTFAAIQLLLKETTRHEKEMKDIALLCNKPIGVAANMEKDFRMRKEYAGVLADVFKTMTKLSMMSALQSEMLSYHLQCFELKTSMSKRNPAPKTG